MGVIRFKCVADSAGNWVMFEKGGVQTIVAIRDRVALVVSATHRMANKAPFVPYVAYDGGDGGTVYEVYLHLIGKMARKNEDSKYFCNPRYNEHCRNGMPFNLTVAEIESLAKDILRDIEAATDDNLCVS